MSAISNIYLAIFLPLIASLFCQIFNKRILSFSISLITCLTILILSLTFFIQTSNGDSIANDFNLHPISLALEFSLKSLNASFLLPIIFVKIVILLFYQKDIKSLLSERLGNIFYVVFLLNIFALTGIFLANNIFNLFLFIEIYGFSYFATFSLLNDEKSNQISLNYFCLSIISSLLLLFAFLAIYFSFSSGNLDKIYLAIKAKESLKSWFLPGIFTLVFSSILIKFFPFWLYFKKMKLINPIADFVIIDTLFIKTAIGLFLILQLFHYFFDNHLTFIGFDFSFILAISLFALSIYSSIKLYKQKHLKIIAAYGSLSNIIFIFICILMQSEKANLAAIFYFLNLILVNLFIFIFAGFLRRNYQTSSIEKLWKVKKDNFLITLPLQMLFFFIAGFPFSILFMANWHLANEIFTSGYKIIFLFAILLSIFVHLNLANKILASFFVKNEFEEKSDFFKIIKKHQFALISFWILALVIFIVPFLTF